MKQTNNFYNYKKAVSINGSRFFMNKNSDLQIYTFFKYQC